MSWSRLTLGTLASRKLDIGLLLISLLSALLILSGLGDRVLWNDEAQTAMLARQINKAGIPQFHQGDNFPTDSPTLSDFNDKGVFVWNTWLPYYLTAISFRIFGESEFSARLPFAVIGFLTILLSCRLYAKLFDQDRRTHLIAVLLLCSSIPFILHVRQARYYALVIFGTVWIVWGFLQLLEGNKKGIGHISAAGLLCYYSFHFTAILNLAALWAYVLAYKRERTLLKQVSFSTGIVLFVSLPMAYYLGIHQSDISAAQTGSIVRSVWVFLLWINGFIMPFALPVASMALTRTKGWPILLFSYVLFLVGAAIKGFWAELVIIVIVTSGIAFVYLQGRREIDRSGRRAYFDLLMLLAATYILGFGSMAPYPFFRYLTPLIPLIVPVMAILISRMLSANKVIGYASLAMICFSTLFSAAPLKLPQLALAPEPEMHNTYSVSPRDIWRWTAIRSDLAAYLREIRSPVEEPERGLINYFRTNAKPGESIRSSYDEITLMFYLPEQRIIPRFLKPDAAPDFLIQRGEYKLWIDEDLSSLIRQNKVHYFNEQIPFPNVVWGNNPDPLYHLYEIPKGKPNIVISKRLSR